MSIVKEVADGIKLVADGIGNIRKIYDAIHDGKEYLKTEHPDVKDDVAAMCIEMRKTLQAIATASSIITHFRFNVSTQEIESEPTRFNDYLIKYKFQAMNVESQLDSLRGHCHIIHDHVEKLEEKAKKAKLAGMLKLFGLSSDRREQELSKALENIYDDEMQFHSNVWQMRMVLERSLDEIGTILGPPGTMDAKNVPTAAKTLGEYAEHFGKLESDANYEALRFQGLIDELSK